MKATSLIVNFDWVPVTDTRGATRTRPPGPNTSIFISFYWQKHCKIRVWCTPSEVGAPGEILDLLLDTHFCDAENNSTFVTLPNCIVWMDPYAAKDGFASTALIHDCESNLVTSNHINTFLVHFLVYCLFICACELCYQQFYASPVCFVNIELIL